MTKSKKIILALIVILIIGIVSLYFLVWRPSNSDYSSASETAAYVEKTYKAVVVETSSLMYPYQISAATPLRLQVLAKSYSAAVATLNESAAINRDMVVKSNYESLRQQLLDHSTSITNLTNAIELYIAVTESCTTFTNSLSVKDADYTEPLSQCRSAIDKASKAEHEQFNKQFLTKYLEYTTKYIDALEDLMESSNDGDFDAAGQRADAAYDELSKLSDTELKFESPNIITAIKDLSTVLNTQKSAFLR